MATQQDIVPMSDAANEGGEIVLYQPNDEIRLEVRLEAESVWLNQAQMAALFATTKQNISLHISNIFKERELVRDMVVKDFLTTTEHGALLGQNTDKMHFFEKKCPKILSCQKKVVLLHRSLREGG